VTYDNGEAWSFDTQEYSKSSQGYQHAVTFIDQNTGLPFSAYQRDKDDDTIIESVEGLITFTKNTLRVTLKYLFTDADSSTLSKHFQEFLSKHGIKFGHSPPYQHYKNDKAERVHKPLRRSTCVLLHAGRLPNTYWPRAHACAVYIYSTTPNARNTGGISPSQAMYAHVPNISDLRLFGSPVSDFHHKRQAKDGTLWGYASIYLGNKEGSPPRVD
jgi:hypothetical protein